MTAFPARTPGARRLYDTESVRGFRARSPRTPHPPPCGALRWWPWGGGIGSAGPASVRNDLASPRIAENHYLQTAQELGWIGLVVLLGLLVTVGRYLWRVRADDLALLLVASLVGLSFINLVSHAWADDTLMILWWVLCGVVVGRGILNEERTK